MTKNFAQLLQSDFVDNGVSSEQDERVKRRKILYDYLSSLDSSFPSKLDFNTFVEQYDKSPEFRDVIKQKSRFAEEQNKPLLYRGQQAMSSTEALNKRSSIKTDEGANVLFDLFLDDKQERNRQIIEEGNRRKLYDLVKPDETYESFLQSIQNEKQRDAYFDSLNDSGLNDSNLTREEFNKLLGYEDSVLGRLGSAFKRGVATSVLGSAIASSAFISQNQENKERAKEMNVLGYRARKQMERDAERYGQEVVPISETDKERGIFGGEGDFLSRLGRASEFAGTQLSQMVGNFLGAAATPFSGGLLAIETPDIYDTAVETVAQYLNQDQRLVEQFGREFTGEDVILLDDDQSIAKLSASVGAGLSSLELASDAVMLMTGGAGSSAKVAKMAIQESLVKKGLKAVVDAFSKKVLGRILKAGVVEAATETIQGGGGQLTGNIAAREQLQNFDASDKPSVMQGVGRAALQGAVGGFVAGTQIRGLTETATSLRNKLKSQDAQAPQDAQSQQGTQPQQDAQIAEGEQSLQDAQPQQDAQAPQDAQIAEGEQSLQDAQPQQDAQAPQDAQPEEGEQSQQDAQLSSAEDDELKDLGLFFSPFLDEKSENDNYKVVHYDEANKAIYGTDGKSFMLVEGNDFEQSGITDVYGKGITEIPNKITSDNLLSVFPSDPVPFGLLQNVSEMSAYLRDLILEQSESENILPSQTQASIIFDNNRESVFNAKKLLSVLDRLKKLGYEEFQLYDDLTSQTPSFAIKTPDGRVTSVVLPVGQNIEEVVRSAKKQPTMSYERNQPSESTPTQATDITFEPTTAVVEEANIPEESLPVTENALAEPPQAEQEPEIPLSLEEKAQKYMMDFVLQSSQPIPELTSEPILEPTPEPTPEPILEPTPEPTPEPILEPTPTPTSELAPEPVIEPTPEPTVQAEPTSQATAEQTLPNVMSLKEGGISEPSGGVSELASANQEQAPQNLQVGEQADKAQVLTDMEKVGKVKSSPKAKVQIDSAPTTNIPETTKAETTEAETTEAERTEAKTDEAKATEKEQVQTAESERKVEEARQVDTSVLPLVRPETRSLTQEEEAENQRRIKLNFKATPSDRLYGKTDSEKLSDNYEALKVLKAIEANPDKVLTRDEQLALSRYVGFGAFAQEMFNRKFESAFAYAANYEKVAPFMVLKSAMDGNREDAKKVASGLSSNYYLQKELEQDFANWLVKYGRFQPKPIFSKAKVPLLLTSDEYESIRRATTNAYFTSPEIVRAMWEAVSLLGEPITFRTRILEAGAGTGMFLAHVPYQNGYPQFLAVERDLIAGKILKALYPTAEVFNKGYQEVSNTEVQDGSVDLVIGNPPFGSEKIAFSDPEIADMSIHNAFIAQSLKKLKAGGHLIVITSKGTMDSLDNEARAYFARQASLVAAVRLPSGAFLENSGTSVTTDIIIFRKHGLGRYGQSNSFLNVLPLRRTKLGKDIVRKKKGASEQQTTDKALREIQKMFGEETADDKEVLMKAGTEVDILANEYFINNQDAMLGVMTLGYELDDSGQVIGTGGLYSALETKLEGDVELLGERIVATLKKKIKAEDKAIKSNFSENYSSSKDRENSFSVENGKPFYVKNGARIDIESFVKNLTKGAKIDKDKFKAFLLDYVPLRDKAVKLFENMAIEDYTDSQFREDVAELKKLYDNFYVKHGRLRESGRKGAFVQMLSKFDVQYHLVLGLETLKRQPDGATTIQESELFTRRTVYPLKTEVINNPTDALLVSKVRKGYIDMDYMVTLLRRPTEELPLILKEVLDSGLVFVDHLTGDLVLSADYLSGDVKTKFEEVVEMIKNKSYDKIQGLTLEQLNKQKDALQKVLPKDVTFLELIDNDSVQLSDSWLPLEVLEDFLSRVIGVSADAEKDLFRQNGVLIAKSSRWFKITKQDLALKYEVKGVSLGDLLLATFNGKAIKITDSNKKIDQDATRNVQVIQTKIKEAFSVYLKELVKNPTDARFVERITQEYNNRFNRYASRQFQDINEDLYRLEGFDYNNSAKIKPRNYQLQAIFRNLQGATLDAIGVGLGKTLIQVATAMEMKRLGLARKPMVVVQNSTLQQFSETVRLLYPSAKVLAGNKDLLSKENRQDFFALVMSGEWDAIIIPQSFWEMIGVSPSVEQAYVDYIVKQEVRQEAEKYRRKSGRDMNTKQLEKLLERTITRYSKLLQRQSKDEITFEMLGVDALLIDEAHEYKKMGFETTRDAYGITNVWNPTTLRHYLKVQQVLKRNGNRNVVLSTGTPITNTIAESWIMMQMLRPDLLIKNNLQNFDDFVGAFVKEKDILVADTAGYRVKRYLSEFKNVRQFLNIFKEAAFVLFTAKDNEITMSDTGGVGVLQDKSATQSLGTNIPPLRQGGVINVVVEPNEVLLELNNKARSAAKYLQDNRAQMKDFWWVVPVIDGEITRASLDLRLYDPKMYSGYDAKGSKLYKIAETVFEEWKNSKDWNGSHAIFLEDFQRQRGEFYFNAFYELKRLLVKMGVPSDEIAIIEDKEKSTAIFEDLNNLKGKLRIVMGTTQRLGVGVNFQERLTTLHHGSIGYVPSDIEQRNGRIIRNRSNQVVPEIAIYSYGVKDTLDAKKFQFVARKAKMVSQLLMGYIEKGDLAVTSDELASLLLGEDAQEKVYLERKQYEIIAQLDTIGQNLRNINFFIDIGSKIEEDKAQKEKERSLRMLEIVQEAQNKFERNVKEEDRKKGLIEFEGESFNSDTWNLFFEKLKSVIKSELDADSKPFSVFRRTYEVFVNKLPVMMMVEVKINPKGNDVEDIRIIALTFDTEQKNIDSKKIESLINFRNNLEERFNSNIEYADERVKQIKQREIDSSNAKKNLQQQVNDLQKESIELQAKIAQLTKKMDEAGKNEPKKKSTDALDFIQELDRRRLERRRAEEEKSAQVQRKRMESVKKAIDGSRFWWIRSPESGEFVERVGVLYVPTSGAAIGYEFLLSPDTVYANKVDTATWSIYDAKTGLFINTVSNRANAIKYLHDLTSFKIKDDKVVSPSWIKHTAPETMETNEPLEDDSEDMEDGEVFKESRFFSRSMTNREKTVRLVRKLFPNINVEILSTKEFYDVFGRDVSGLVVGNTIFLNEGAFGSDTVLHELGHIWAAWAKKNSKSLYDLLEKLVLETKYYREAKALYSDQTEEVIREEAIADAIADAGVSVLNRSLSQRISSAILRLFEKVKQILNFDGSDLAFYRFDRLVMRVAEDILEKRVPLDEVAVAEMREARRKFGLDDQQYQMIENMINQLNDYKRFTTSRTASVFLDEFFKSAKYGILGLSKDIEVAKRLKLKPAKLIEYAQKGVVIGNSQYRLSPNFVREWQDKLANEVLVNQMQKFIDLTNFYSGTGYLNFERALRDSKFNNASWQDMADMAFYLETGKHIDGTTGLSAEEKIFYDAVRRVYDYYKPIILASRLLEPKDFQQHGNYYFNHTFISPQMLLESPAEREQFTRVLALRTKMFPVVKNGSSNTVMPFNTLDLEVIYRDVFNQSPPANMTEDALRILVAEIMIDEYMQSVFFNKQFSHDSVTVKFIQRVNPTLTTFQIVEALESEVNIVNNVKVAGLDHAFKERKIHFPFYDYNVARAIQRYTDGVSRELANVFAFGLPEPTSSSPQQEDLAELRFSGLVILAHHIKESGGYSDFIRAILLAQAGVNVHENMRNKNRFFKNLIDIQYSILGNPESVASNVIGGIASLFLMKPNIKSVAKAVVKSTREIFGLAMDDLFLKKGIPLNVKTAIGLSIASGESETFQRDYQRRIMRGTGMKKIAYYTGERKLSKGTPLSKRFLSSFFRPIRAVVTISRDLPSFFGFTFAEKYIRAVTAETGRNMLYETINLFNKLYQSNQNPTLQKNILRFLDERGIKYVVGVGGLSLVEPDVAEILMAQYYLSVQPQAYNKSPLNYPAAANSPSFFERSLYLFSAPFYTIMNIALENLRDLHQGKNKTISDDRLYRRAEAFAKRFANNPKAESKLRKSYLTMFYALRMMVLFYMMGFANRLGNELVRGLAQSISGGEEPEREEKDFFVDFIDMMLVGLGVQYRMETRIGTHLLTILNPEADNKDVYRAIEELSHGIPLGATPAITQTLLDAALEARENEETVLFPLYIFKHLPPLKRLRRTFGITKE